MEAKSLDDLELALAKALVAGLNLDLAPETIDPDAPLYGDGLGLDSIDMLEISLVVARDYGVQLRSDNPDNQQIFSSLRNLNQYIQSNRTR
ncbi:acyl carrier protein [Parasulfuritortus cantonensis]|uniref:Acyl carrier protein n=1 Tax=Parasulfuritortus cantonensis TaxID=2528202 RepID=A0A4R1BF33_9PROT|nr:phosphopantetheine-binding protein [Parasulfuritortus cantonensis]TCJ15785.1 acyl carrier protein [Parasulfuritortus cantonensis]